MSRDSALRLRPVRVADEAAVRAGQDAMVADDFLFALELEPEMDFADYVAALDMHRRGLELAADRVPATFLLAVVHGEVVGRTSVRHELNDRLRIEGGHIGYGVLPAHRRRGYAREILRQSLVVARSYGIERALLTCDDDNLGSIAVIESNGGRLDPEMPYAGDPPQRRYWID